jgi:hypothetical protein
MQEKKTKRHGFIRETPKAFKHILMKLNKVFQASAFLLVVLTTACEKEKFSTVPTGTPGVSPDVRSAQFNFNPHLLRPVNLGLAGSFTILSKTGITDVYKSSVRGDVGSSPITGAAVLLKCTEVVGTIYTVDAAGPLPCRVTNATRLTSAVSDMQSAYADAAGRSNPDFLNLGAGNIGGKTLTRGLYKWTSALIIPTSITITGGPNDIFIFQVAGTLQMSSAVNITLTGGALAKNIFWQTAGAVTIGTGSHFEGIILGKTGINFQTGSTVNGRLLAQTAVTLQMNAVTQP